MFVLAVWFMVLVLWNKIREFQALIFIVGPCRAAL